MQGLWRQALSFEDSLARAINQIRTTDPYCSVAFMNGDSIKESSLFASLKEGYSTTSQRYQNIRNWAPHASVQLFAMTEAEIEPAVEKLVEAWLGSVDGFAAQEVSAQLRTRHVLRAELLANDFLHHPTLIKEHHKAYSVLAMWRDLKPDKKTELRDQVAEAFEQPELPTALDLIDQKHKMDELVSADLGVLFEALLKKKTIAEKLDAFQAILNGAISQRDFLRGNFSFGGISVAEDLLPGISVYLSFILKIPFSDLQVLTTKVQDLINNLYENDGLENLSKSLRLFNELVDESPQAKEVLTWCGMTELVGKIREVTAQYEVVENHLKQKEYGEAATAAALLFKSRDLHAIMPPGLQKYLGALSASSDLLAQYTDQYALSPSDRRQGFALAVHNFLRKDAIKALYSSWASSDVQTYEDASRDMNLIMTRLFAMNQTTCLIEFTKIASEVTGRIRANPYITATNSFQALAQNLDEMVRAINLSFTDLESELDLSSAVARIRTQIDENPLSTRFLPAIVGTHLGNLDDMLKTFNRIKVAVEQKNHDVARTSIQAFLANETFRQYVPQSMMTYVAETQKALDNLPQYIEGLFSGDGDTPISERVLGLVRHDLTEVGYRIGLDASPERYQDFRESVQAILEHLERMKNARTLETFLAEAGAAVAAMSRNDLVTQIASMTTLSENLRRILAAVNVAHESVVHEENPDLAKAAHALNIVVQESPLLTLLPEMVRSASQNITRVADYYEQMKTALSAKPPQFQTAASSAQNFLADDRILYFIPTAFQKHANLTRESLLAVNRILGQEPTISGLSAEAYRLLESEAVRAFFHYNESSAVGDEEADLFADQMRQAIVLLVRLGNSESFDSLHADFVSLMRVLEENPVLSRMESLQSRIGDARELTNQISDIRQAYNDAEFSQAILLTQSLPDSPLLSGLPGWFRRFVDESQNLRESVGAVERALHDRDFIKALHLSQNVLESAALKAVAPNALTLYTDEIGKMIGLTRKVSECAKENTEKSWDAAYGHVLEHFSRIEGDVARKRTWINLLKKDGYEELKYEVMSTSKAIKDLIKVCNGKNKKQKSILTALAVWANKYLFIKDDNGESMMTRLERLEIFTSFKDTPEMKLMKSLIKNFSKRGSHGAPPTLDSFTLFESVAVANALERYFYESGKRADAREYRSPRTRFSQSFWFAINTVITAISFFAIWVGRMIGRAFSALGKMVRREKPKRIKPPIQSGAGNQAKKMKAVLENDLAEFVRLPTPPVLFSYSGASEQGSRSSTLVDDPSASTTPVGHPSFSRASNNDLLA